MIWKPLSQCIFIEVAIDWRYQNNQARSTKDLWLPTSSCDHHYPKAILIHLVSDESTSTINKRQADSKGMRRNMEFIILSEILCWERIYSQISWAPKHKDLTSIFVVVVVLFFFPIFFCMFTWLICLMPFGSPFSHQVQSDYWLSLIDLNLSMLLWLKRGKRIPHRERNRTKTDFRSIELLYWEVHLGSLLNAYHLLNVCD